MVTLVPWQYQPDLPSAQACILIPIALSTISQGLLVGLDEMNSFNPKGLGSEKRGVSARI